MPFDPKDFLATAKILMGDAKYANESTYRTCVSRAYYSAFLVCRTFLEKKHGFHSSRSPDVHRLVVKRLRGREVIKSLLGVPYWARFTVADALKNLRENGRNEADYDMMISIGQGTAQYWIQQAEYIVNRIP